MHLYGGDSVTADDINALQAEIATLREAARDSPAISQAARSQTEEHGRDLLREMILSLYQIAEAPPKEVEGVSEEFCAGKVLTHSALGPLIAANRRVLTFCDELDLDRVPRSSLKPSQSCPICSNPFLDDKYPLVVRLPCHPTHMFDLECVRPWLRLRGTCPLDRTDFAKQLREKAEARKKAVEEDDDEEEWDGMYG